MDESRDERTYAIIGAAMEVHRVLGHGFLEHVYQLALAKEFMLRGIPFAQKPKLVVYYKGEPLDCGYEPDFICFENVIVEIKALAKLTNIELAQAINYLKATGYSTGLVLNFGAPSLEHKRVIFTQQNPNPICGNL
jgi:GxxExxY protein